MSVHSESISLIASRTAPRFARRFAIQVLSQWPSSADIGTVELIISEMVTNVVDALGATADVPPWETTHHHRIGLYLCESNGILHISVRDNLPGTPKSKGLVDTDAEGGRGLFLIETMSSSWGHYKDPRGGKVVWCQIGTDRQEETPTTERRSTRKGLPRRRSVARLTPPQIPHDEHLLKRVLDALVDL